MCARACVCACVCSFYLQRKTQKCLYPSGTANQATVLLHFHLSSCVSLPLTVSPSLALFLPSRTRFLNSRDGNVEFQPPFCSVLCCRGLRRRELQRGSHHLMVLQLKLSGKLEATAPSMRRLFSLCDSRKHQHHCTESEMAEFPILGEAFKSQQL